MTRLPSAALGAALVVTTLALPTRAGDCRRAVPAGGYVAPAVAPAGYDYGLNPVIVPKAFQVAVAAPFYLGVSDEYRQLDFARRVAEEYAKLVDLRRAQPGPAPPPIPPAGAPTGGPLTVPPDAPPAGPGKSLVGQVLSARCASCHTGGHAPDLSGDPDRVPAIDRLQAFLAVASGEMPKGKPPLPQDELNLLAGWAKAHPAK